MSLSQFLRSVRHHLGNVLRAILTVRLRLNGIRIGKNTMVSLGAHLDMRRGEITIGDDCLITKGVVILSHDGAAKMVHPGANGYGKVVIGNHVFIGVNAIILPNVTIGDNAVVAAGAVVTKDVPAETLVAGNPARAIKKLSGPFPVLNCPPEK